MKKLFENLQLWYLSQSIEVRNSIEFIGGIALFFIIMAVFALLGYISGKSIERL